MVKGSGCRFLSPSCLCLCDRQHGINPHGREALTTSFYAHPKVASHSGMSSDLLPCMVPHVRLANILLLHHASDIFSSYVSSNMHVKGCSEPYSRIKCHVSYLQWCSFMQTPPLPQMCVITLLTSCCSFSYVCCVWCANEWHSDSFEGLC